jgi:hypothetical protein
LIVSGAASNAVFTATTVPETGAYKSEAALTDSTTPKVAPAFSVAPTFGSWTYVISPRLFWA